MRTLIRALERRCPLVCGQLALARMDDRTAAAFANNSTGEPSALIRLPRWVEELASSLRCAVVSLHIRGADGLVADALPRPIA